MNKNVDLLKGLSEAFGVSGFEEEVRKEIRQRIEGICDEIEVDSLGNLMAWIKKDEDFVLMLDAHMDEVGFMVSHIEKEGFVRIVPIGSWDTRVLPGQPALLCTRKGTKLHGVIGTIPPHIQSDEERKHPIKIEELVCDLGMASEQEVLDEGVCPGSPGTIYHPFRQIREGVVVGKAFDDRAGCAILIQALAAFSAQRPDFTVVANFAIGEEVGLRGAMTATARIEPNLALIVEGTIAADIPGVARTKQPAQMGRGPAITVADRSIVVNPTLVAFIEEVATECKIPWQTKIPLYGATDAGAIHVSGKGVPSAVISVPCRYIHSPISLMRLDDFANTCRLLIEVASRSREAMKRLSLSRQ